MGGRREEASDEFLMVAPAMPAEDVGFEAFLLWKSKEWSKEWFLFFVP